MLHRAGVISLLGRQRWVASVGQFRALGVSRQSVASAVRRGALDRLAAGVVGLPGEWDTFEGRAIAVHLAAGRRGYLSGASAARILGMRGMPSTPIRYSVGTSYPLHLPPWGRLVRTSWPDDTPRPVGVDQLPVASPLRVLFDLAADLSDERFERAAEDAWHLGLITPETAAAYLARVRRSGRTGVRRYEEWLERVERRGAPAETGLEQFVVGLVRRAGLPEPVRQHRLRLLSGREVRLDLAWPDVRLAVEPGHSWWHGGDRGQRADQDRDRECAEIGWQVVRVDETVWERRDEIIGQLRRLYRSRTRDIAS